MALEALKAYAIAQTPKDIKEEPQRATEPESKTLTSYIKRDKQVWEYNKKQSENIIKSEHLRTKINRELIKGEDISLLFIEAIECISLMTGDKVFYENILDNMEKRIV